MKISRDNYETFFIDYLDGKLSDAQIHEFEAFLLRNPDLREEVEGLEKIHLEPEHLLFAGKENLKNPDLNLPLTEENFEFFCIAQTEGDLNPEERKELQQYLENNPDKREVLNSYFAIRLKPDKNIVFPDKSDLKKSIFIIPRSVLYRSLAIAAGIAVLLVLFITRIDRQPDFYMASENTEVKDTNDTTAVAEPGKEEPSLNGNSSERKAPIIPVQKGRVKEVLKRVEIKAFPPDIAAIEPADNTTESETRDFDYSKAPVIIDPAQVKPAFTGNQVMADRIDPIAVSKQIPVKKPANPDDYLSINEFVKMKFSELVFREREAEISGWGLASAGIEKINDVAGTNMKLEAKKEEENGGRKLNFNSKILSFSTPINREN